MAHRELSGTPSYHGEMMPKCGAALPKERRFSKSEVSSHSHSLISKQLQFILRHGKVCAFCLFYCCFTINYE